MNTTFYLDNFVETVEEIRNRRQSNPPPTAKDKKYTINELNERAFRGYKGIKARKVIYPPFRSVVMGIADYLDATLEERNRLLVSAGHAPIYLPLKGDPLRAAFSIAESLINYLPIPAFYITREWSIHGWNKHAATLYDVHTDTIRQIPDTKRNVLQLIFDPEYPIYHRLHADQLVWEYTAKLNIYGFKYSNLLCTNEDWYQERVQNLFLLSKFREFWEEVNIDSPIIVDPVRGRPFPTYSTKITTHGESIWVLGTHTSLGNFDFPIIVSYVPYDQDEQRKFTKIGLPTPENDWTSFDA